MSQQAQNRTAIKRTEAEEIQSLRQQVRDLEQKLAAARNPSAERCDRITVAADELPVDFHGFMPRRVEVSLRPELRRKIVALHRHLKAQNTTIRHPRYHDQTRHVDDLAHVMVWLIERVELVGHADA